MPLDSTGESPRVNPLKWTAFAPHAHSSCLLQDIRVSHTLDLLPITGKDSIGKVSFPFHSCWLSRLFRTPL
ncbi:hypothetical protein ebA249 [Aromatoleum aromaticum EbN1]|uniref:Uncharacterized protein n=1 Tax=Aromatoleum aromaticum (strain DSM 19018 / LMG 30748 / EbN1) TaxID=76114 RepID=Q5P8V5_AROAE|nr:hypothetical protein ebA249 [Aromatoleum aromaticum EbN1]